LGLIEKLEYYIKNTKTSMEKVNTGIEDLRVRINQTEKDTKSVRYNIELIKKFELNDFNIFYSEFCLIIEQTESKFRKITKKKEKLEFCKFMEKEVEREKLKETSLRET
jgi:hypothetical protein